MRIEANALRATLKRREVLHGVDFRAELAQSRLLDRACEQLVDVHGNPLGAR